jgi:predicted kinase
VRSVLLAADSNDVVVVAGLPGAGKTTLVAAEPRAVDSDAVREAWAPRLAPLPYRIWRPLVHARHWVAIWRALGRSDGVVVVRPFTSTWTRRSVLRRALRHHAAVHLVVVEATPAQAREGQRARGRTISARAMRRHERRWASANLAAEPWTTMTRVPSRAARARAHPPAETATNRLYPLPNLEAPARFDRELLDFLRATRPPGAAAG